MIDIIVVDNEFAYFNEIQKLDCEESIEIGYSNGQYIAITNTEDKTNEEIKDFLFLNKVRTKYGKLQRASDSNRM